MLLGEVHVPGIEIDEKTLTPTDLESADEVFITSTTRDLLPVWKSKAEEPGGAERTRVALQKAFSGFVERYVAEHAGVARSGN